MAIDTLLQHWELASYVVTVFGLPYALWIFWVEKRRQIKAEEAETYQRLSDEYGSFLKLLLDNADLRLILEGGPTVTSLSEEQRERKQLVFEILVALFERAFILVYARRMSRLQKRLWATWDDYIQFWCRRPDFVEALPALLEGEDPEFQAYIGKVQQRIRQESGNGQRRAA